MLDQPTRVRNYYKECDTSYQHWGVEEIYNIHYGFWDRETNTHIQSLENMNRTIANALRIKAGDTILDAGCGVGATTIWIAQRYDVRCIGITISELQCRKAKLFAEKRGVSDKVDFYTGDYHNTGFKDLSFDAVWSLESLCHGDDKHQFIRECYRILKKDGRLVVADFFLSKRYAELNWIQKWLIERFVFGWCLAGLWSVQELEDTSRRTGFENVEVSDITKNILPSSMEIYKRGYRGYLHDRYIRRRSSTELAHVASNIYQGLALRAGAWRYQILYAEKKKGRSRSFNPK